MGTAPPAVLDARDPQPAPTARDARVKRTSSRYRLRFRHMARLLLSTAVSDGNHATLPRRPTPTVRERSHAHSALRGLFVKLQQPTNRMAGWPVDNGKEGSALTRSPRAPICRCGPGQPSPG